MAQLQYRDAVACIRYVVAWHVFSPSWQALRGMYGQSCTLYRGVSTLVCHQSKRCMTNQRIQHASGDAGKRAARLLHKQMYDGHVCSSDA